MKNFPIYKSSPAPLGMLLAIAIAPQSLLAQTSASETFPLPSTVPSGTNVQIAGSNAMEKVNAGLKQRFEKKFPGTEVKVAYSNVDAALQELIDGKVDLVAIGRPLTAEEKAKGLSQLAFARHKMAIFVSANNPYPPARQAQTSLSNEQFAKIFRGEITNWSEVGGKSGEIKVIDRPDSSESRQALGRYKNVFPEDSLKVGSNGVQLTSDRTEDVIKELGNNGISYAPAGEVVDNPGVRVLWLYNTPPTNPKYPFSLPLSYVYKGATPPDKVKAFLGYALAPENQDIITDARFLQPRDETALFPGTEPTAATTTSPETAPTATPGTETAVAPSGTASEADSGSFPWWLLLIPLLGIPLLLWLLKGKKPAAAPVAAVAPVVPVVAAPKSRIVLTPRDCRNAYAYWEIPSAELDDIRRQGNRKLGLRLHDVTDIPDLDRQNPHSTKQFACDENLQDLHLLVPVDDRDYVAELGYETSEGRWVSLATSERVRVPTCTLETEPVVTGTPTKLQTAPTILQGDSPTKLQESETQVQMSATKLQSSKTQIQDIATVLPIAGAAAGIAASSLVEGGEGAPATTSRADEAIARIILVPRNCQEAYAYWEVSDDSKEVLRQRGGRQLMLRVYQPPSADGSEPFPQMVQAFDCNELDWDRHVPIPTDGVDYVAELGYMTGDRTWLSLATSSAVRIPPC